MPGTAPPALSSSHIICPQAPPSLEMSRSHALPLPALSSVLGSLGGSPGAQA